MSEFRYFRASLLPLMTTVSLTLLLTSQPGASPRRTAEPSRSPPRRASRLQLRGGKEKVLAAEDACFVPRCKPPAEHWLFTVTRVVLLHDSSPTTDDTWSQLDQRHSHSCVRLHCKTLGTQYAPPQSL